MKKVHLPTAMLVTGLAGSAFAGPSFTLDGVDYGDPYGNTESITWWNGHGKDSLYGDQDNQFATSIMKYGKGTLNGSGSSNEYFFLYFEAPLYAKNMIWVDEDLYDPYHNNPSTGLNNDDWLPYSDAYAQALRESLSDDEDFDDDDDDDKKSKKKKSKKKKSKKKSKKSSSDVKPLDFSKATGSEKAILYNDDGDEIFVADLADDADDDGDFGLLGYKDSSDYLLDNGLATLEESLNRDVKMSFEMMFALDDALNSELINNIRNNGIEFHLSPERSGQPTTPTGVPSPTAGVAGLVVLGLAAMRRRKKSMKPRSDSA